MPPTIEEWTAYHDAGEVRRAAPYADLGSGALAPVRGSDVQSPLFDAFSIAYSSGLSA